MDKIKTIKIKNPDGSVSEETYTISVNAKDVDMKNGKDLQDTIGDINVDKDGSIAEQLDKYKDYDSDIETLYVDIDSLEAKDTDLENDIIDLQVNKINKTDIIDNLNSSSSTKVLSAKQGKVLGDNVEYLKTSNNKKPYYYNTVADMKADTKLKAGDMAITLGYYEANDGGNAEYKIIDDNNYDNDFYEELNNGLWAELIIKNNEINIKQFGALPLDNNKHDLKHYIDKYIELCKNKKNIYKLYIPTGVWSTSPITIDNVRGLNIYGDLSYGDINTGTLLIPISNQTHILQLGTDSYRLSHWTLRNITFSNNIITYSNGLYNHTSSYYTTNVILKLLYATFGMSDNIMFHHIKGEVLNISSSWENYFNLLDFRQIDNPKGCIIRFAESNNSLMSFPNISACNFEKMMFEQVHGHLIQADSGCNFINNHIGVINFEDILYTPNEETYVNFNSETIDQYNETTDKHLSIFNILGQFCCVVDSLELNNFCRGYFIYNNNKYAYDTIINAGANGFNPNTIINNIHVVGMHKKSRILKQNSYYPRKNCILKIANVNTSYTEYPLFLDVSNYTYLECDDLPNKSDSYTRYIPTLYPQDVVPFYKNAKLYSNDNFGGLTYDSDTQNNLHLAVKPFNTTADLVYQSTTNAIVTGKNVKIRAKIPNGITAILCFEKSNNSTRYQMSMVGTGDYEVYDFKNIPNDIFPFGTIVGVRLLDHTQVGIDCYLDYYKFY